MRTKLRSSEIRVPMALISITLCAASCGSDELAEAATNVPSEENEQPDDRPIFIPSEARLPGYGNVDCTEGSVPTMEEWVASSDAVFVGEVVSVEVNVDRVYEPKSPPRQVEFEQCLSGSYGSFSAGLIVSLENVQSLAGDELPERLAIEIGEGVSALWSSFPLFNGRTFSWSSESESIGAGMILGGSLFYDAHHDVWTPRFSPLIEFTDDETRVQPGCFGVPAEVARQSRQEFGRAVEETIVTAEVADQMSSYRDRSFLSPDERATMYLASFCRIAADE